MGQLENTTLFVVLVLLTIDCLFVTSELVETLRHDEGSLDVTSQPSTELETSDDDCLYSEAFHTPTNSCYSVGSRGPCNPYETWYAKSEDADEGECHCAYSSGFSSKESKINRPLVRSEVDNRCYPLFSQANCNKADEWFTHHPNKTGLGVCTPNTCANSSTDGMVEISESLRLNILRVCGSDLKADASEHKLYERFWFTHENKCVKTFTLGTCGPVGGNHTLIFRGTHPTPICVDSGNPEYKVCRPEGSGGGVASEPITRTNLCPQGYNDKKDRAYTIKVTLTQDEDY